MPASPSSAVRDAYAPCGRELHRRHGAARGEAVVKEHLAAARAGPLVVAGCRVRRERERRRRLLGRSSRAASRRRRRAAIGPDGAGRPEDLRDLDVHDHAADLAADLVARDERRQEILAGRVRGFARAPATSGTSTVPKWLTLPTCMSSRTRPWLRDAVRERRVVHRYDVARADDGGAARRAARVARARCAAACRLHGSSPAASADDSRS